MQSRCVRIEFQTNKRRFRMNGAEKSDRHAVSWGVDTYFSKPPAPPKYISLPRSTAFRKCAACLAFRRCGYGCSRRLPRMAGKPACTLLHLGPGLGNGLANLHNARRAEVPLINLVGQPRHIICTTIRRLLSILRRSQVRAPSGHARPLQSPS
jgi:Thiamine pyrophosphate enzyme, N-terminal TPP binding domain